MKYVSATELAKMGKCEKQVYLDYHKGEDAALTQDSRERGNEAHIRFHRRLSGQDRRCFIATAVFGPEATETCFLRAYRDNCLMPSQLGRFFVRSYYLVSPYLVKLLEKSPVCIFVVRWTLRRLIKGWSRLSCG